MERPTKFNTCPARLRKRDVPAMWDLFQNPRDPASSRASSPLTVDEEDSSVQVGAPLSRRTSFSSVTSEGSELIMEAGGSWPRIRKQRTSENRSMSLFDVTEALEHQHLADVQRPHVLGGCGSGSSHELMRPATPVKQDAVDMMMDDQLSNLEKLVAAEEAAAAAASAASDGRGVSVDSFVDAVFSGMMPSPDSPSPPVLPPARAGTRPPTANELALLEAIAADEAAAAAEAAALAAAARAKVARARAGVAAASVRAQHQPPPPPPTHAHSSGAPSPVPALAPAPLSASAAAPAAASGPATALEAPAEITSDELLAMLQVEMDLPSPTAAPPPAAFAPRAAHHFHSHESFHHHPQQPPSLSHFASFDERETEAAWLAEPASASGLPAHRDGCPFDALLDDLSRGAPLLPEDVPDAHDEHAKPRHLVHGSFDDAMGVGATLDAAVHSLPQDAWASRRVLEAVPPLEVLPPYAAHPLPAASALPAGLRVTSMPPLPPPLPAAALAAHLPREPPPAAKPARNGAERKEWTEAEDSIIKASVVEHGCRWRKIASRLPGRSDDAVRNRWNRLREMREVDSSPSSADAADGGSGAFVGPAAGVAGAVGAAAVPAAGGEAAAAPTQSKLSKVDRPEKEPKPERISWTKAEDETILRSVAELGHKWNRIAERLPGRTDHAIRNRFHRLQSLLEDRVRQQQRILAPAEPLHMVSGLSSGKMMLPDGRSALGFEGPQSDLSHGGFDTPRDTPSGGTITPGSR
eukprot:CAMPEP_0115853790 /NCGR_PEP_ID=MMETSP0287-20121206/13686_1 /TAXON_ID=412157 /ORGANISM="Chrysochromulina rotalis, Strain UIO044" /LENGTH=751 /DNA_ID=CAMNT_0003307879 /DNA_START=82 /DNA_END=2337 /DNA_ORIENTATION=+